MIKNSYRLKLPICIKLLSPSLFQKKNFYEEKFKFLMLLYLAATLPLYASNVQQVAATTRL